VRVEDQDDADDLDDLDDTTCTRQKPARRHCWQWFLIGDYVVIGCGHCPKVRKSWTALDGDRERVRESEANHAARCARLVPWRWVPAQRRPAAGAPPAASRPAGATSRRQATT
jgi:hypothetical protein